MKRYIIEKKVKNNNGGFVVYRAESWGETIETLAGGRKFDGSTHNYKSYSLEHSNYDEELRSYVKGPMLLGYPEGRDKIAKLSSDSFAALSGLIERHNPTYDIEGGAVDVGRYLSGEPECFMKFETTHVEGLGNKIVRILYNIEGGNDLVGRGAMVAALTELLEFSGFVVSLDAVTTSSLRFHRSVYDNNKKPGYVTTVFPIKQMGQPVDIPRLSTLCHSSMFGAALQFQRKVMTDQELAGSSMSDGSGSAGPIPAELIQESDIYIDQMAGYCEDPQAFILEQLKSQGVKLHQVA